MEGKLKAPTFVKVKDLQPGVHGFNVYLKVKNVEESEPLKRADGTTLP